MFNELGESQVMTLTVYHGGTDIIEHPLCKIGRDCLDFGRGFYVTDIRLQAVSWAVATAKRRLKDPVINVYRLDKDAILAEARCKVFTAYDKEWLDFIVANRTGFNVAGCYDYVEGGVADDRVIDTINLFLAGLMPEYIALERLAQHQPNNQICLLNQRITDKYLKYENTTKA